MPKKPAPASERKANCLFYGPPKHGKTVLIGTAAQDKRTTPTAILDFEGGVLDVLDGMPKKGKDWVHFPVGTWDDFNTIYNDELIQNKFGFKSCSVDSLSETHIFALMTILDNERVRREEKGTNPDLIEQGDYGVGLVQLRRLVRYFRDLPMHTFYTAHHKEDVDAREGRITTVNLSGKAAVEIPGLMTAIGYLALTEDDDGTLGRVLLLQNYAKIRTGVRMPWGQEAPDEIENPTITKVLDALKF